MDPQQIAQMLASGKPDQIKAAQTQLQALGYDVKPDGKLGAATSAAVGKYRSDFAANEERTTRKIEGEGKIAENNPTNRITKLATEVTPYAVGIGTGSALGHYGFGKPFAAADKTTTSQISDLARARNINPAVKEAQMDALLRGRTVRNAGQFGVPALLAGGGYATRNYVAPMFSDPQARDIVNSVGTGENAAALTLGAHQAINLARSMGAGNPTDIARIRSEAMPSAPAAPAPAPPAAAAAPSQALPAPESEPIRHSERLKLAAVAAGGNASSTKEANVSAVKKGLSAENMADVAQSLKLPADASRPQILQRLRELSRTGGKLALPLAAGAVAYDAMGSQAEAKDGRPSAAPSTGEKLGAGAVAAGSVAGTQRLMQALEPTAIGRALGTAGRVAGKVLGPEAMLASPEAMHIGEAMTQRLGLPSFQQRMADRSGASQLPERGERGLLGRRDINAAALQIPPQASQSIPEQAEKTYPAALTNRIQRMTRGGASADQIAAWLNANAPADL